MVDLVTLEKQTYALSSNQSFYIVQICMIGFTDDFFNNECMQFIQCFLVFKAENLQKEHILADFLNVCWGNCQKK